MHSNTIIKSLFLKGEPSFLRLAEVLHALNRVRSQDALDHIAQHLIEIARHSRLSRDSELGTEATNLLKNLPVSRNLRWLAEYYSTPLNLSSAADLEATRERLLRGISETDARYVPSIILKLGNTYDRLGKPKEALRCYAEAGKAAIKADTVVTAEAALNIAIVRSDLGDHIGALKQMERVWPVLGLMHLTYYYAPLNNLALVLTRAGRIDESRGAIARALASPLAHRFPEWVETQREIEEAAQKEPCRSSAAARLVLLPAPEARPREVKAQSAKKSGERRFVIPVTDIRKVGTFTPLPFPNGLPVVSLLERYVKTVRIRQP